MLLAVSDFVASLAGRTGARTTDRRRLPAPYRRPACSGSASGGAGGGCSDFPRLGLGLLLIPILIDPPDILVAPDGRAVAVRDAGGVLRVSGARAGSYAVEQFFDEEAGPPAEAAALREGVRCDASACLLHRSGTARSSAMCSTRSPSRGLPRRRQSIATRLAAPSDCARPLVIDAAKLQRFGAHAVRIEQAEGRASFRVRTERSAMPRPWQAGAALPTHRRRCGHEVTGSGCGSRASAHQDPSDKESTLQYFRNSPVSRPWMRTRSGPKMRVS